MKHKTIKLSLLLLSIGLTATGQEAITSSGGDATGSGGSVAYSVGQTVYSSYSNNSANVNEGVQQAFEIFTLGVEDQELNSRLSVFPNPTTENINLQIDNYEDQKMIYRLHNMQGKLLNTGKVDTQKTQIKTEKLQAGVYFIHIVGQQKQVKQSFKIIKK